LLPRSYCSSFLRGYNLLYLPLALLHLKVCFGACFVTRDRLLSRRAAANPIQLVSANLALILQSPDLPVAGHLWNASQELQMRKAIAAIYSRLPIIRELHQIIQSLDRNSSLLIKRNSLLEKRNTLLKKQNLLLDRTHATQAIRLLDFDLQEHPRYGDPQRLLRYHSQVCSQNGEDGIIHEIFQRIGTVDKSFVEVGVGSGIENNTAFLLFQGWTGFWIDASDDFLQVLENGDRQDSLKDALNYLVSFVTAENIGTLFEQLGVPKEFDLLSLDIDQNTYYIWESLNNFRPRLVVIEYNAALPADVDWKVPYRADRTWNGTQNFGASLKALELLGRQLDYSLVGCDPIGVNAFFVRNDLVENKFSAPLTSENHYEPPRYSLACRRTHRSTILDRNIPASGAIKADPPTAP